MAYLYTTHIRAPCFRIIRAGAISPTLNPEAGRPPLVTCPWLLIQYVRSWPVHLEAVSSIRSQRTRYPVVTKDPPNVEFQFVSVQRFGSVINCIFISQPEQNNRNTENTRSYTHSSSGIRTHKRSVRGSEAVSCLRLRDHRDCPRVLSAYTIFSDYWSSFCGKISRVTWSTWSTYLLYSSYC